MRVNVAVCGVFHYYKYVEHLARLGVLHRFYYAHRRSTHASSLRIAPEQAVNLWAKEYLYRGLTGLLPRSSRSWIGPVAHDLWQGQLLSRWSDCDLFHLMLHGTGVKALEHARARGAVTVGEPVMAHPHVLQQILQEEHALLGIAPPSPITKDSLRLIDEQARCDFVVAGSNWIRESFIRQGTLAERTFCQPYGSDTRRFFPLTDAERSTHSDGKFRVIVVAQVVPRKGHVHLLEAWKRLRLPAKDAELLIVGSVAPEMKPVLGRYEGLFTHVSAIPHEQLRFAYGRSSVFVLPSVEDGFGYVTTEAMSCGLPVITTRNAGSADVVEEEHSGFVVPARSPEALAEKIGLLHRDPDLRHAMGQHGLRLAQTTLSWSAYSEKLVALYSQMLAAQRTPRESVRL